MGITLIQNGTIGQQNFVYSGSGAIGHDETAFGYEWYWLPFPGTDVSPDTQSIITTFNDQIRSIEQKWDYWLTEHPTEVGNYLIYKSNDFKDFIATMCNYSKQYHSYKMCVVKDTGGSKNWYRLMYADGPNSYDYGGYIGIYINKDPLTDYVSTVTVQELAMETNESVSIGLPIYNSYEDAVDFLLNQQEDPPGDDPGSSIGGNSSIVASDSFDDINEDLLSNLTILAEIDTQNLDYIADALNTNLDASQDLGENLMKVARALCQSNIKDGIMSLKAIPIPVNGTLPYKSGQTVPLFDPIGSHPVSGKKLNKFIKKYDIGVMRIEREFNDYRDYMCDYSLYLPFSGIHKLDASIVVGQTLILKCDIDFLCGTILYHVIINDNNNTRDIYQFTGDCAIEIPITSQDYSQKYQAIVNGIFSGVGMLAGSAVGGPFGSAAMAGAALSGLQTTGNALMTQGHYLQTGKLVPNSSALSCLQCYIIINKPISVTPANMASVKGRPCHKVKTLNNCSGFTIASNVKLDGVPYATDEDKEEIRSLLSNGVYL